MLFLNDAYNFIMLWFLERMNHPDHICEAMISEFRVCDFKSLLECFYCSKYGNKTTLKNRVLQVLRCKPKGIHNDTFKSKIVEIYNNLHEKTIELLHGVNYQNMFTEVPFQQHPLLLSFPPPPPPQSISFGHSDYTINNSHQPVDPIEVKNYINQQHQVYMNSVSNDMRNTIIPTIKVTKLPFYEIIDVVFPPTIMSEGKKTFYYINMKFLFKLK